MQPNHDHQVLASREHPSYGRCGFEPPLGIKSLRGLKLVTDQVLDDRHSNADYI